jgi:trans-2,3-dihydro-3-hydroxyanthranilate isomerase
MRELRYSVLDVFAENVLEGNPLAVFHDARSLSDEEMQALARETNLAETTFVIPTDDPEEERERGVRVRIFTTQEEFPFAGHPTLGTASWVRLNHPVLRGAEEVTLRLGVGPIPVTFEAEMDGKLGVRGTMRQNDPEFGREHEPAEVAKLLGLEQGDLVEGYRPQTVSTGLPFCVVLLRSAEVLGRLQVAQREAEAWLKGSGAKFFYCVAPMGREEAATGHGEEAGGEEVGTLWRARMQFYSGEDPATGSAAGCCISWLLRVGLAKSGEWNEIRQGVEIKRPSRIGVRAEWVDGKVGGVMVSGRTIPVAEGLFFLP